MIVIVLLFVICVLIYLFLTRNLTYWSKRGIRGPKPTILLGSLKSLLTGKQNVAEDVQDIYNAYKNKENVVGIFMFRSPLLLVLDPKQVTDVLTTNFSNFHDNDAMKIFKTDDDPIFKYNPFVLSGEAWKEGRAVITPGLTSMRMKASYPDMLKVTKQFSDYIEQQSHKEWINAKDLALKFTTENICQSVLGVESRAFTDNPVPVPEHVSSLFEDNVFLNYFSLMTGFLPELGGLVKIKFSTKKFEDFFTEFMKNVINLRRQSKLERSDYMDYILSLKDKKNLEDSTIFSHLMTFLVDGLETSAMSIAHTLLLLAANPLKAKKLRDELAKHVKENNTFDFEKLTELPYLDACIYEALRFYPPALFLLKTCTADHEFYHKNGSKVKVNKGEAVYVPVYALHNDEEIFPNPKEYQPERFLPENGGAKKYTDMGAFLPFSNGPRRCIGMRFALLQMKLAISSIILNFELKTDPNIQIPKLNAKAFFAIHDGEMRIKFTKIEQNKN